MTTWEIFIIAVALSMDAFAVSVAKGLATPKYRLRHSLCCGLWFGAFQAIMPLFGYHLGRYFTATIDQFAPYIAFALLLLIGTGMIKEAVSEEEQVDSTYSVKHMLPLAVATSIDALAIGVTFAFLHVQVVGAVAQIGVITCILSAFGVRLGSLFGEKYAKPAQIAGGLVLILMGTRTLLAHLLF